MNDANSPELDQEAAQVAMQRKLEQHFPNFRPSKSAPPLFQLNGFGLAMAGKKNREPETGAYQKAHCITLLFIPVLALGSHVVADAPEGGWYFLGKSKNGLFAKIWNFAFLLLVVAVVAGIGWIAKTSSPEYRAEQELKKAHASQAQGDTLGAARQYFQMISRNMAKSEQSIKGLSDTTRKLITEGPVTEAKAAVHLLDRLPTYNSFQRVLPEAPKLVRDRVESLAQTKPEEAFVLLEAVENSLNGQVDITEQRAPLLKTLLKTFPDNPDYRMANAEMALDEGDLEKVVALIENGRPSQEVAQSLADSEGARIYGQALLHFGRFEEAFPLLENYVGPRLKQWQQASRNFTATNNRIYQKYLDELNEGEAPDQFYRDYENASEEEQALMVDNYIQPKFERDPAYQKALRNYQKSAEITPVIMDLGLAQLRTGQNALDANKRKVLLEEAEKTFLSLRQTTGDSEDFQFLLGQVYFWLGKQDEGRKEFDNLLVSTGRSPDTLMTLASIHRELGNTGEAKDLVDESYKAATDQNAKDAAAMMSSILSDTNEESISWLDKIQNKTPTVLANLAGNRGHLALSEGDYTSAISYYRQSDRHWEEVVELSSSKLNNHSLILTQIFNLTGDAEVYERSVRMLEQALELQPESGILASNTAYSLLRNGTIQLAKEALGNQLTRELDAYSLLRCLYSDEESRQKVAQAFALNADIKKSESLFRNATIIAPNTLDSYFSLLAHYVVTRDEEKIAQVLEQLDSAQVDREQMLLDYQAGLLGYNAEENSKTLQKQLVQLRSLADKMESELQKNVLKAAIASNQIALARNGSPQQLAPLLKELLGANQKTPCVYVSKAVAALTNQIALEAIIREVPDAAEFARASVPMFSASEAVLLAAIHKEWGSSVLALPEVQAALEDSLESADRFPNTIAVEEALAAFLLKRDNVEELRKKSEENQLMKASVVALEKNSPWQTNVVLAQVFRAASQGDLATATAAYQTFSKNGIDAPIW